MKLIDFVRCSCCKGELNIIKKRLSQRLICKSCGAYYPIDKFGIPNLLPPKIRTNYARISKGSASFSEIENQLNGDLSDIELYTIRGILASANMAPTYKSMIADTQSTIFPIRIFEEYEFIFIDNVINKIINRGRDIILIELGCGPGRYMERYGIKISNATNKFPNGISSKFLPNPKFKKRLSLIIGIDFEKEMLKDAINWIREIGLSYLLGKRIVFIQGASFLLNLDFTDIKISKYKKIIISQFNTLGNQQEDKYRIQYLKDLRRLGQKGDLIIISTFNKNRFKLDGIENYYKKVTKCYGNIKSSLEQIEDGILWTDREIYTKWFSIGELKGLLKQAGYPMERTRIYGEKDLPVYHDYESFLSINSQNKVRRYALIVSSII